MWLDMFVLVTKLFVTQITQLCCVPAEYAEDTDQAPGWSVECHPGWLVGLHRLQPLHQPVERSVVGLAALLSNWWILSGIVSIRLC